MAWRPEPTLRVYLPRYLTYSCLYVKLHPSMSTIAAAMKSTIVPVLDDEIIKNELERVSKSP